MSALNSWIIQNNTKPSLMLKQVISKPQLETVLSPHLKIMAIQIPQCILTDCWGAVGGKHADIVQK